MSLTRFTGNTNAIAQLPDTPSLTSEQLKAKFDEAGSSIKDYLNNDLAPEVEQLVAEEKSTLQRQISNLSISTTEAINNAITTENMIISDQYSTMKTYKIGDLCIYNNVLYKCITEISVAEAWNSEHWEQTTITDSINGKILYEDSIGNVGTVNLSESFQTGDEIEIIYCRRRAGDGTSVLKSTGRLPYSDNMEIALDINYYSSDVTQQVISKIVFVNGNSIIVRGETTSSNSGTPFTSTSIYILKVIKY